VRERYAYDPKKGTIMAWDGRMMDVESSRAQDGARVLLWVCTGNPNQSWRYDSKSQMLRSALDERLALSAHPGRAPGTQVTLAEAKGHDYQRWTMHEDGRIILADTARHCIIANRIDADATKSLLLAAVTP
jgi:hypothetical protein